LDFCLIERLDKPAGLCKKTNVPGICQMPKVERERTGCWRTRAMRRLRWNFVVDKRQGHGRSGLFARVKCKPASRSRIGSDDTISILPLNHMTRVPRSSAFSNSHQSTVDIFCPLGGSELPSLAAKVTAIRIFHDSLAAHFMNTYWRRKKFFS
jgi:hypothetical protein